MTDKPDGQHASAGPGRPGRQQPGPPSRRAIRGHGRDRAAARSRPRARHRQGSRLFAAGLTPSTSPTTRARPSGCPAWRAAWPRPGAGVEPIMQLTCRDRNRIALQSELLSASALGVPNVLIMTGDHPRHGDHADAKPVFDLDSTQLLRVATSDARPGPADVRRRAEAAADLASRRRREPAGGRRQADGAAEAAEKATYRLAATRSRPGAQFVQTQFVFDVPAFAAWMRQVSGPRPGRALLHPGRRRPGAIGTARWRTWPGSLACTSPSGGGPAGRRQPRADPGRGREALQRDHRRSWPMCPAWPACT